jgi:hypothetical protein
MMRERFWQTDFGDPVPINASSMPKLEDMSGGAQ